MSVSIKLIDGEDPKSLYQYDIGRQIQIVTNGGETIKEVQFSNVRLPEALIVLPKLDESGNIIADVPNIFTLEPRRISVYLITYLENGECVKYKDELNVIPRKKPSDYVYTETEVLNYSLLEKQINSLESTKLTAPSSAQVGQIFRVQSITEDGNLVLEAVDMPSGGAGIAVTGATVGQTVKIAAVDDDGVPTAWEPADMPSGEAETWELIRSVTIPDGAEEANALTISTDSNGFPFSLKKAKLFGYFPVYTGKSSIPTFSFTMLNGVSSGNLAPYCYTNGWALPNKRLESRCSIKIDLSISGLQCETTVRTNKYSEEYFGDKRIDSITSIGGRQMLIYPGCRFILCGVRA